MKLLIKNFLICIIIYSLISLNVLVKSNDDNEKIENLIKIGDEFFQKGKYDLAIENYSNVIDLIGSDVTNKYYSTTLFKRAGIYNTRGKNILALSDLNRAIEVNPENIHALIKRAKVQSSLGRFEDAIEQYKKILKIRPDHEQTKKLLENLKKVEKQLDRATELVKQDKNYKEAIPILQEILNNVSDLKEARIMAIECYYHMGDTRRVLDETMSILKAEPTSIKALYWRGRAFFSMGEKEVALKFLKEGLKFSPDDEDCRSMLKTINKFEKAQGNANELFNQNKFQESINQIEVALEIEPNSNVYSTPLYLLKCKALLKLKKAKESIDACTKAIELDDANGDAYFNRGEAWMFEDDYQKALNDYNKAREFKPNDPAIHDGIRRAQKAQKMEKRKDYYKILGIPKTATNEEVKKAFKKLAIKNHPDKSNLDKEKAEKIYMEINEAYEALKDEEKRRRYDMGEDLNEMGGGGGGGHGFPFQGGFPGGFNFGGFQQGFQQGGGGGGGFQFHFR